MPSKTFFNLSELKQEHLLDTAFSAFSEKVFEKVKVVHLCERMNIPRVTFYSYFSDLADLYSHLITKLSIDSSESLVNPSDLEKALKEHGEFLKRLVESDQGQRVLFEAMKEDSIEEKIETHILLSLARQYELNLITFREFFKEYTTLIEGISRDS